VLRLAILVCLIVSAHPAGAQPADPREKDPVFLQRRTKADIETAAHEVFPRCADETQNLQRHFWPAFNAQPPVNSNILEEKQIERAICNA